MPHSFYLEGGTESHGEMIPCIGGPLDDAVVELEPGGRPRYYVKICVGSRADRVGPEQISVVYPCAQAQPDSPAHLYQLCHKRHYHYQGIV